MAEPVLVCGALKEGFQDPVGVGRVEHGLAVTEVCGRRRKLS